MAYWLYYATSIQPARLDVRSTSVVPARAQSPAARKPGLRARPGPSPVGFSGRAYASGLHVGRPEPDPRARALGDFGNGSDVAA